MDTSDSHTHRTRADSFDEFYRSHREAVFRALLVTLRNPEAAAGAVDEDMTRALKQWDTVAAYERPDCWVYRVRLNWAISAWRRNRLEVLDILVEPSAEDGLPDPEVAKALARLPVRFRAVVVCRYCLDWSTDGPGLRRGGSW